MSDAAHRLSRADELYCETARITILERVWGADRGFLARHGETYRKVLDRHRLARAKELLARGRTLEARQELRALRSRSSVDFTLACLPGPLAPALWSRPAARCGEDARWPEPRSRWPHDAV